MKMAQKKIVFTFIDDHHSKTHTKKKQQLTLIHNIFTTFTAIIKQKRTMSSLRRSTALRHV